MSSSTAVRQRPTTSGTTTSRRQPSKSASTTTTTSNATASSTHPQPTTNPGPGPGSDSPQPQPQPQPQAQSQSQEGPPLPSSLSRRALSQTLTSTANLANLLPTGTLLAFQLLTPLFTNNGTCDSVTRLLTLLLLLLLGLSCFIACFTDSVRASDGKVYHGLATPKGLWLFDYPDPDPDPDDGGLPELSKYRVRPRDWVHAVLSVLVFCAVALRDKNVVSCFYPKPEVQTQEVLDIVPVGIGLLCSLLFVVFPTTRHGIGYPVTSHPST